MEETGCEVICGAPTTPMVKGQVKVKEGKFKFLEKCGLFYLLDKTHLRGGVSSPASQKFIIFFLLPCLLLNFLKTDSKQFITIFINKCSTYLWQ